MRQFPPSMLLLGMIGGLVFIWLVVNRILNDPSYDKSLEDFALYLAGKKGVLAAGFLSTEVPR